MVLFGGMFISFYVFSYIQTKRLNKIWNLKERGNPEIIIYEAGTSELKETYTDSTKEIMNTNPIILDYSGKSPTMYSEGCYQIKLKK
jgi:hypothetical protein